jgi:hypothetical protein
MAKKSNNSGESAETPIRFKVRLPGFSGPHPVGIRFQDNLGYTDNPAIAEAARQQGWEVTEESAETSAD